MLILKNSFKYLFKKQKAFSESVDVDVNFLFLLQRK